jgi:hypothetical protein
MASQLRQEPLPQSPYGDIEMRQSSTGACAVGWQRQSGAKEQEREWEGLFRSLQQCICELLIKNQQLRYSLISDTNCECQEFADEYDRNAARD